MGTGRPLSLKTHTRCRATEPQQSVDGDRRGGPTVSSCDVDDLQDNFVVSTADLTGLLGRRDVFHRHGCVVISPRLSPSPFVVEPRVLRVRVTLGVIRTSDWLDSCYSSDSFFSVISNSTSSM